MSQRSSTAKGGGGGGGGGGLATMPKQSLAFNAPCFFEQTCSFRVSNEGGSGIFWKVTASNKEKYGISPENGSLKGKANIMLDFKCRPFFFKSDECASDCLTFEWCDTPPDHAGDGTFNADFFSKAKTVSRHVMQIRFNP